MTDFKVKVIPGDRSIINGRIRRRVVLQVEGRQRAAEHVTLDSSVSVIGTAKRWARDYGIDESAAADRLRQINITLLADSQKKRAAKADEPGRDVHQVARDFLAALRPQWHRDRRSLFLDSCAQEVKIADLWCLAGPAELDGVDHTDQAYEVSSHGEPPYMVRLTLFKNALRMEVGAILKSLPRVQDVERDDTVDRGDLVHRLVAVLIKVRIFRTEVTTVSHSYFAWACGLQPKTGWVQCYGHPVFARIDDPRAHPKIAIQGDHLTSEMGRQSSRRLASDLRAAGLADTSGLLRCNTRVCRAWVLHPEILDEIETCGDVTDDLAPPTTADRSGS